jgi:hypothetical protein
MTHADAVRTLAAERYLLDDMPEIERFDFEDHYFDCAECAEEVRAGALLQKAVRNGMLEQRAGGPVVSMPNRGKRSWLAGPASRFRAPEVLIPWAAAATLALVVGYQSLAPGGNRLEVQGLTPVTLRPATRGAVATVRIPEDGGAVAIAMEVDAPPASALTYELSTASGNRVAEGRLIAPGGGAPLLLLVPSWTLTPSTEYSLAIRAADRQLIGEYRFAVETP